MKLFRKQEEVASQHRAPRVSSGWADVLAWLKTSDTLRVLDFGPTSPANINYLTGMGHGVYMANIVDDAQRPEYVKAAEEGGKPSFDTEKFIAANLDFSGRDFDLILLWDTADYLPAELVPALFKRLSEVMRPRGRLLAFFHGTPRPGEHDEVGFSRYQLSESKELTLLAGGNHRILGTYNVRQVEQLLAGFADLRFFLAKDNVREVVAQK